MSEGNVPEPRAFDNASEAPADIAETIATSTPAASTPVWPNADRDTLGRFIASVFKGIETGQGHIMFRSVEHRGKERPLGHWHPFGDGLLSAAAKAAAATAARRGDEVAVFCPPPCVFGDVTFQGRRRAYEDNVIACGVIAIELDEQPRETLAKAKHILGEPTLVLRSGGVWGGPDGPEDKLHAYWRLTVPATTKEDLRRLKMVRYGLLRLCGGDGTAVPLSHPMRWAGSWHTKDVPRLSTIVSETENEIALSAAEDLVATAADIAGVDLSKAPPGRRSREEGFKTGVALGKIHLDALAAAVPNPPVQAWDMWNNRGLAFFDASHGSPEGLEAFHLYSAKSDLYDPDYTDLRWEHYERHPPSDLSAGSLVHFAKEAASDFKLPFDIEAHFDAEAAAAQPQAPAPVAMPEVATPSVWFSPPSWTGQVIKPREWEVENWIPRRQVTLLYGDGGIGKTLLAQQLATAMAAGIPWLGQVTRPGRVLCVFCEDDPDELHRRQADINRALGLTNGDLANMLITSRTSEDNVLATWGRDGRMELRPLWYEIRDRALAFCADAIILDPLSDIYAGSEIDRGQVTTFVKGCLGRLAHEIGGSVVVLAHPSQSGMSSGQGTSGSSAWSNAVRSRLYLSTLSDKARELTNMKLNYGPKGSKLKLEWHQGAFRVTSGTTPAGVQAGMGSILSIDDANEQAVARALNECRGQQMTLATTSKYNAPKLLKRTAPETLAALKPEEVTLALDRLVGRGEVEVASLGKDPHSRDRPTLVFIGKAAVEGQSKGASAGSG
ncbi:AAA family ATPase [Methylobacterium sp. WL30]|uniref:AAA family ATPase n=1 Tax=unclassified Methylobacterium TaxID=2615210 RepID=UPI0011CB2207|nr:MULTISPECIES: AAA family ATPase [unclassified Methylobacterium]TXN41467.1 AAA family ATPase [Methylobacterium sp. WL93]TXN50563.1 AAA family ATPase [Methylobacterium sp. WL119]TXN67025.1 AAA family ATPase [Methylobacterium sp. WL30]